MADVQNSVDIVDEQTLLDFFGASYGNAFVGRERFKTDYLDRRDKAVILRETNSSPI